MPNPFFIKSTLIEAGVERRYFSALITFRHHSSTDVIHQRCHPPLKTPVYFEGDKEFITFSHSGDFNISIPNLAANICSSTNIPCFPIKSLIKKPAITCVGLSTKSFNSEMNLSSTKSMLVSNIADTFAAD